MKDKIGRLWKNYQKAFIPAHNQLRDESIVVKANVNKKLAETNCRRIVAVCPLLLILYICNFILLIMNRDAKHFVSAMMLTGGITVFTIVLAAIISWILFFNKIDNEKETWKFKIAYRLFWPGWFIGMAALSYLQLENGYMGLELLITCVIVNLLPLHNLPEFLTNLVLTITVSMFLLWGDLTDGTIITTKMEIIYFTAMQLLGYLVQRMQIMLWSAREYLFMEAFIDPLTELLNRRGGNAMLQEVMKGQLLDAEAGIIMFDIDYFKKYNDTFGHDAGDNCLRMVGQTIREIFSNRTRIMIRHGGEEFIVILFDTNMAELENWAEKLRIAVYDKHFDAPEKEVADYVTVSIGIAMKRFAVYNQRYEELLLEVDAALYEAKRTGRNCVACAGR